MTRRFLAADRLVDWLNGLAETYRVLAPAREGAAVVFRPFDGKSEPVVFRQASMPPKEAVFPQTELLMSYKFKKNPELGRTDVEVTETIPSEKTLVFGASPCGARGFTIFDPVFDCGRIQDPYYTERRKNTVFVTVACVKPERTCFCHWVGGGPDDASGSDILLTPVEGGYMAEGVTEAGKKLLEGAAFADASKEQEEAAAAAVKAAREKLGEPADLSAAPAALQALFDDLEFWEDVAAKCVSCGACTYLCPTCWCFNITDEANGKSGERIRTWDTCMSPMYTREASGHNPRPAKAHRWRNRAGHKFNYHPGSYEGTFACCGCGRCIKQCPVGVDIREIVTRAIKRAGEGK